MEGTKTTEIGEMDADAVRRREPKPRKVEECVPQGGTTHHQKRENRENGSRRRNVEGTKTVKRAAMVPSGRMQREPKQ